MDEIDCHRLGEMLCDFVNGELADEMLAAFEAHMKACPPCVVHVETYRITVVDPINVAAGSPTLTVTPPAYARQTFKSEILTGFHDLTTLQHSRVRLDFRFTQPAREALLSWPADKKTAPSRDQPRTLGRRDGLR